MRIDRALVIFGLCNVELKTVKKLSPPNNDHNPNNETTITVVGFRLSNCWKHHHHPLKTKTVKTVKKKIYKSCLTCGGKGWSEEMIAETFLSKLLMW